MNDYPPDPQKHRMMAKELVSKLATLDLAKPDIMKPPKPPKLSNPPSMKPVAPPQPKANFAPKFNPNTGVTKGTSPFTVSSPSK